MSTGYNSQITLSTIYSTGSNTSPIWFLNNPLFNVQSVKISQAILSNEFYNIDSRNNNLSFFNNRAGTTTSNLLTITPGNYTASGLATQLTTQLNTAVGAGTYSVSYSSVTGKITIDNTTTGNFMKPLATNGDCYYELGITSTQLNVTSGSLVGNAVVDCSGVKCINLISNSFGDIAKMANSNYSIIGTVPVHNGFLGIENYENSNKELSCNISSLYSIGFLLYDERMRQLTVNKDYQITLSMEHY